MSDWRPDGWDEPPHEPDVVIERAGIGIRVVAKIADGMVFSMFFSTIRFVFGGFASREPNGEWFTSAAVLTWVAATILLEARVGWTPGKHIVGLRVRTATGRLPTLFEAAIRNLVYSVGALPLVGAQLSLAVVASIVFTIHRDVNARGWHDKVAGTVVQRVVPTPLR